MSKIKIALCQTQIQKTPEENLKRASEAIKKASEEGAEIVILPEMFVIPYDTKLMKKYAEPDDGNISNAISKAAKDNNVLLIAGSFPELCDDGKIYNTCLIYAPNGKLKGKYRKMHLFDVNIKYKTSFTESEVLSAGEDMLLIKYRGLTIGVAICFDVRFVELFRIMALKGAELIVIPASFAVSTGEMHWDLSMRSRAVDNQVYIAAASPARNPQVEFQPWGHSLVSDPWGKKICEAGIDEEIVYAVIDTEETERVREQLPILKHRRTDKYETEVKDIKINIIQI